MSKTTIWIIGIIIVSIVIYFIYRKMSKATTTTPSVSQGMIRRPIFYAGNSGNCPEGYYKSGTTAYGYYCTPYIKATY